jgi:two-component system phosphate regulon response regulator PhoB
METQSTGAAYGSSYRDEHFAMDFEHRTAAVDSEKLILTHKEYELLSLLVRQAGRVIPRQELLSTVWGYGPEVHTRTLDVHVRRLRSKLGIHADRYIETIFGIGYRFQPYDSPRFELRTIVGGS